MATRNTPVDPFAAFGVKKATRGRQAGTTDKKSLENTAAVVEASKSAVTVGKKKGFFISPDMIKGKKAGEPAGYDTLRTYARKFCDANKGWTVEGKTTDGRVLVTKPVR